MVGVRSVRRCLGIVAAAALTIGGGVGCAGADDSRADGATAQTAEPTASDPTATRGASTATGHTADATASAAAAPAAFTHGIVLCTQRDLGSPPVLRLVDPASGSELASRAVPVGVDGITVGPCSSMQAGTYDAGYRYWATTKRIDGSVRAGLLDFDAGSFVDLSGVRASAPDRFATTTVSDSQPRIARRDRAIAYWVRVTSDGPTPAQRKAQIASVAIDGSADPTVIVTPTPQTSTELYASRGSISLLQIHASPSGRYFLTRNNLGYGDLHPYLCRTPPTPFVETTWAFRVSGERVLPTGRCTVAGADPIGTVLGMTDDTHWIEIDGAANPRLREAGGGRGEAVLPQSGREVRSIVLSADGTQLALVTADATAQQSLFVSAAEPGGQPRRVPLPASVDPNSEVTVVDWV